MQPAAQPMDVLRQVVNVVGVIVTLIVNGLANALPLNGRTTASISDQFPVLFVPAGYVFAIWGVIYLGLIAFAVYQALPSQRTNPTLRRIGWLFAASCVANSLWIFLWHWELFPLTLLVMGALLLLLIAIYRGLDRDRAQATLAARWAVYVPFSLYLGWITVATIANATDLLSYLGWTGWPLNGEIWTVLLLLIATGIAGAVSLPRRDAAYLAVLVWAFVGIGVKQADTPLVATTAGLMAVVVALILLAGLFLVRPRRSGLQAGAA
jgi:hypothetical protein